MIQQYFTGLKEFKLPFEWNYRGEGNKHLVIALPKTRKILRIRKTKQTQSFLTWLIHFITGLFSWYVGTKKAREELRDVKFYKQIIRPLLGNNYVCDVEPVFISKKQIKNLEGKLNKYRPNYRKYKILQSGRASLFEDYAFLPNEYYPFELANDTYAIEIKPKQGWIPFSERHFPKCYFCMNQYLKLENGQISKVSSYCPTDLFSGEKLRMIKAIKLLINNPQNNFRIFKNGNLYFDEKIHNNDIRTVISDFFNCSHEPYDSLLEEFSKLIQKCLITNFKIESNNDCSKKLFCKWNKIIQTNSLQNELPKGSVLEKIFSAQMLDVEGNEYYYKLLNNNNNLKDYNYVEKLLESCDELTNTCLKCSIMMMSNSDNDNRDLIFVPYLISSIVKDCSLMVTFKKIKNSWYILIIKKKTKIIFLSNNYLFSDNLSIKNIIETKFGSFIVNVGILDLYPKPLSTIKKQRKNIKKMLQLNINRKSTPCSLQKF